MKQLSHKRRARRSLVSFDGGYLPAILESGSVYEPRHYLSRMSGDGLTSLVLPTATRSRHSFGIARDLLGYQKAPLTRQAIKASHRVFNRSNPIRHPWELIADCSPVKSSRRYNQSRQAHHTCPKAGARILSFPDIAIFTTISNS